MASRTTMAFQKYGALHGARFLGREFSDDDTALACCPAPEYQAAKVFPDQVGEIDPVIVPGFED